jgi:Holliday junction DNA helicase RuvA
MYDQVNGMIKNVNGNTAVISTDVFGIRFMFPTNIVFENGCSELVYLHYSMKDVNGTINQEWYGFKSEIERNFFRKIISIKGIGEKTAITILSVFTPLQLIQVIRNKDAKLLSKVPKIGQKSAEKYILDMEKLNDILLIKQLKDQQDINQGTNSINIEDDSDFEIDMTDVENADKTEGLKKSVVESLSNLGFSKFE